MRSYDKITTLYERLSRDDELQGDSNSCGSYKFEGCIKLKGLQTVAQFDERVINHIKQIPWGHNQRIINKCKTIDEAIYYVDKTIENGWSRNVLVH